MGKKVLVCHTTMKWVTGEQLLTRGKEYNVLEDTGREYTIEYDNGERHTFNKRKDAEDNSYKAWLD